MAANRRILQLLTLVIFFVAAFVDDGSAQRRRTANIFYAIDSIGVGIRAPGAMLHIQPDSSSSHRRLFFVEDTTGQAANDVDTSFVIMAGGKTGIGTASPNAKLQVAGVVNIDGFDTGNFIADEYDLRVGTNDTAAVMRIGNLEFGTSDDRTVGASLTAGGAVFFGVQNQPDGIGEFIFTTADGDIRLAIPRAGAGYATNNARSGTYAGPSVMKDSIMIASYWGFDDADFNTSATGADLGVQDDLEVMGKIFIDTLEVDDNTNIVMNAETKFTNNVGIDGGLALSLVTKTTTYTATINDHTIICDGTSGTFTVTLPTAASSFNSSDDTGLILEIKKIDSSANAITVDGNGAETIDGSVTAVISTQYNSITIQSDGTEWWIL